MFLHKKINKKIILTKIKQDKKKGFCCRKILSFYLSFTSVTP